MASTNGPQIEMMFRILITHPVDTVSIDITCWYTNENSFVMMTCGKRAGFPFFISRITGQGLKCIKCNLNNNNDDDITCFKSKMSMPIFDPWFSFL